MSSNKILITKKEKLEGGIKENTNFYRDITSRLKPGIISIDDYFFDTTLESPKVVDIKAKDILQDIAGGNVYNRSTNGVYKQFRVVTHATTDRTGNILTTKIGAYGFIGRPNTSHESVKKTLIYYGRILEQKKNRKRERESKNYELLIERDECCAFCLEYHFKMVDALRFLIEKDLKKQQKKSFD